MQFFVTLLLAFTSVASALYGPKSNVIEGTAANFKDEVLKHDGVVVVEFYAPWCGHCKSLAPEYDKAASTLKGVVKVVGVDATQHESLAQKYSIQGFPTLKVFGADKKQPIDYQGARTADAIISEAMKQTNSLVKDRKAGKSKASGGGSKSSGDKKEKKGKKGSDVVELNDVNFNALVMDSNDHWMVEFFAPWCGHCKALAPKWEKAATKLASQGVKVGAVDATASPMIAQKYGIKGYPTIKLFPLGDKSAQPPVDYQQAREVDDIVQFALNTLEDATANAPAGPVTVSQLTDEGVFASTCGQSKLCAVLFLPHILDTGAAGREEYLRTFHEIAQEVAKLPFAFVWVEANAQPELENTLNINGNFPTLAVLSADKKIFAVPKISWTRKNMSAFLSGVLSGTEKTSKFSVLPAIAAGPAWDGKDGELVVDEISLDELFGDE